MMIVCVGPGLTCFACRVCVLDAHCFVVSSVECLFVVSCQLLCLLLLQPLLLPLLVFCSCCRGWLLCSFALDA